MCSRPGRDKPKTIRLVFTASQLNKQHEGVITNTGWHGIMIMCTNGVTCLSAECCVSELALLNVLVESKHHHHPIEYNFCLHGIAETLLIWR